MKGFVAEARVCGLPTTPNCISTSIRYTSHVSDHMTSVLNCHLLTQPQFLIVWVNFSIILYKLQYSPVWIAVTSSIHFSITLC